MTFLLWVEFDVFDVLDVVRQNGDADLFGACQHAACRLAGGDVRRAICVSGSNMLATPDAMTLAVA
jgi:hypothetical protein